MTTVFLSVASAMLFGAADFMGGTASREESSMAVTAISHLMGAVCVGVAMAVVPAVFSARAVIIGVAVGVCSGVGVSSFYVALARGKMTAVAPLTAALSAALPLLWDLTRGAALSATSLAGVVFALIATAAVGLSSSEAADDVGDGTSDSTDVGTDTGDGTGTGTGDGDGDERKMTPLAFMLTLVASLGFAGMYFGFAATPSDSGFWPLLAARVTSTLTLTLATTFSKGRSLKLGRKAWPLVLGAGVLDAVANIMVLTALRLGPFSVAVVLSSLYPVTTVLLARAILGERLKGIQRAAVAIAFASVVLAAWP